MNGLLAKYSYNQLEIETKTPVGHLEIGNFGVKPIIFDNDLANLLGIGRKLQLITYVKRLTSLSTYFIHCADFILLRFDRQNS